MLSACVLIILYLFEIVDVRNAIKITHGTDVFVYKTEKGQEKQTMLVNIKRTTDEIVARSNESRNKGMTSKTVRATCIGKLFTPMNSQCTLLPFHRFHYCF